MPTHDLDTYARRLVERHAARTPFQSAFDDEPPPGLDAAYAVQDAYMAGLGLKGAPAGYKVGMTTAPMQALCGVDEPVAGAVLAHRIHASPALARTGEHTRLGMECEIAVRIGAPLPADGPELDDLDFIAGRLDAVFAAYELIDDSCADYARLSAASMVADNVWNAGLVLGPAGDPAAIADFSALRCVLEDETGVLEEASSREVLGNPLRVVGWLSRNLARRGRRLEPGQVISTGSIIRTRFVRPGERFRYSVEGLGPVELAVDA